MKSSLNKILFITCLISLISFAFVLEVCAQQASDAAGIWQGTLSVQGMNLRVIFTVAAAPDGKLTATMDSPDQGAAGIPVDSVTNVGGKLSFLMPKISGTFTGLFEQGNRSIEGTWTQHGMAFPLTLAKVESKPEVKRPQEPKKPYPYDEEEVTYDNPSSGFRLAGTLTKPKSGAPFCAVILITGSGAQDRDENVFGHKPFLVLSDYLTRKGIGVLRVDDRGVGGSRGTFKTATTKDFATDVRAGIDFLKSRKDIDPKKIGLLGHSEGGVIAPMVAADSKDVAFIVLMAGTGVTGDEILYAQAALIAEAAGASKEAVEKNKEVQQKMFSVLKQEKDDSVAASKILTIIRDGLHSMSEEEKKSLEVSETALDQQVASMVSPWYRFFISYDPRTALRRVACPVLAINGEKDLQVPPKQNLPAVERALRDGGNTRFVVKELPGLNHLFQTAKTGSPSEYATTEETISPTALKIIGDWILEQCK